MNIDDQRIQLKGGVNQDIYKISYVEKYGVYTIQECLSYDDIDILNEVFEDGKELSPDDDKILQIIIKCLKKLSLSIEIISVRFENHKSKATMTLIGNETNDTNIFNLVLPLQDVSEDMGPCLFYPNTNNIIMFKQMIEERNNVKCKILERNHVLGTVKKGDCIVYQSNILKLMTDNISDIDNRMLIITYKE